MKKKEQRQLPPNLSFEEAMKKILQTPKQAVDKAIEEAKKGEKLPKST